jgi:S-adenosylmethionine:tRNA ribosyltransferase-isomerase
MHISDFDYELPAELIAQQPLTERDASRMLVLDRGAGTWQDSRFAEFPSHLRAGDVVVLNNTRVFPARLTGERMPSGGRIELLLVREVAPNTWEALTRPGRRLKTGVQLRFGDGKLLAEVVETRDQGLRVVRFTCEGPLADVIDAIGQPPLPPYIKRPAGTNERDRDRYQTVYARARGSIAAPTAGLHFTKPVMDEIRAAGVTIVEVTLHVGYGTFEPVRVRDLSEHCVAPEWYSISEEAAGAINAALDTQRRVLAIGTTTSRALESANEAGRVVSGPGMAKLTIIPGYQFRTVNALLTNFHLPRSSLLMLVSAFAGRELVLAAYRHAVKERYRFYSYGDCMLIV